MSNLEFEDQGKGLNGYSHAVSRESKIVKLLLDKGVVNNRNQANYLLVAISIVCFILSLSIMILAFNRPEPDPPTQQVIEVTNRMNLIR